MLIPVRLNDYLVEYPLATQFDEIMRVEVWKLCSHLSCNYLWNPIWNDIDMVLDEILNVGIRALIVLQLGV